MKKAFTLIEMLIVVGIIHPLGEIRPEALVDNVIVTGIQAGYQTMDVLAALVFGAVLIKSAADKGYEKRGERMNVLVRSALLAGVLLLLVYLGLAYLGATVSKLYPVEISRADLVIAIVQSLLGKPGMIIFALVVALACVTTAVALVSSAANHFAGLCRGKVPSAAFVVIVCVFSAVVSNLGLDTIVSVAAPILGIVYPPVLVLVIVSLVAPRMTNSVCIWAVVGALITSILQAIAGFGVNLPLLDRLPLSSVDMGWVLPALLFGVGAWLYRIPWQEKHEE